MRKDDGWTTDYDARPDAGGISEESRARDHEQRDLNVGTLFLSLVVLALLVVVAAVGMRVLQRTVDRRAQARVPAPSPMVETDVEPPEPRLERTSGEVLRELRAMEEVQLSGYSWLDRETGIAHLPIERAMEIVADHDGQVPGFEPPAGMSQDGGQEE